MPLPDWLIAPMTEPSVRQYEGYLLFDTEPKTSKANNTSLHALFL